MSIFAGANGRGSKEDAGSSSTRCSKGEEEHAEGAREHNEERKESQNGCGKDRGDGTERGKERTAASRAAGKLSWDYILSLFVLQQQKNNKYFNNYNKTHFLAPARLKVFYIQSQY